MIIDIELNLHESTL